MAKVTLQAMDGKYQRSPVFVQPFYDDIRNVFIVGGEQYPAKREERARGEVVFVNDDNPGKIRLDNTMVGFAINSGDTYDTEDPSHAFILTMIRESEFVAASRREYNPSSRHRLFILDPEEEAGVSAKRADLVFAAMEKVKDHTAADHRDLAFYFGQPVTKMSEREIEGYVKGKALSDPSSILKALDNEVYSVKVFINKLLQLRVLTMSGSQIMHGEVPIGTDMNGAVAFVKNAKNRTLVEQWMTVLQKKGEAKKAKTEKTPE